MRLLFQSYAFHPSVGGIESSARLFIREFAKADCELRIHTCTPLDNRCELEDLTIRRNPSPFQIIRDMRWANVIYQHNPSLRLSWPSIFLPGKPQVISIRTWMRRSKDDRISFVDRLKRSFVSRHTVVANSQATAADLGFPASVIENTYDEEIFRCAGHGVRKGAVYVGRLVSDKGCITAIEAIAKLRDRGVLLELAIVGSGPDEASLQKVCRKLELESLVHFHGRKPPIEVAAILNGAKYQLIPSKWAEPFGIVALEGIACGCIPIASNHGGLVDAVGGCGPLFPPEDSDELATIIADLEKDPSKQKQFLGAHSEHLRKHSPALIAGAYLEKFREAIQLKMG